MIDNIKNKIDVRLDYAQPVYLDNFCHNHTVAACHLDGLWEDIKIRLHDIIPLVKSAIELRKEKNLTMLWTERQIAELEWKTTSDPFIRNEHWKKTNRFI